MARQRAALDIDPTAGDAALATQATAGSLAAFEELYRRHAQAAWRVAQAVTRNPDDASDAVSEAFAKVLKAVSTGRLTEAERFRSYLLTATRNAALDVTRRTGRVRPTDEVRTLDRPAKGGATSSDAVVEGMDHTMVLTAFDSLPERWRSVLWLTEVEGIPAREAAGMLGVSANGVAQLAVRARAGLRERFLQAHLRAEVDDTCRYTVDRLGAYVAGGLAPRDIAKVDQHLAACDDCRARKEELEDLGSSLRRIVLPFPLGLAALTLGKWKASAAVGATTAGAAGGAATQAPAWLLKAQRPLAVASVAMFAAGIVGVGVVGQSGLTPRDGRSRDVPGQTLAAPTVNFTPAAAVSGGGGFGSDSAARGGAGSGGGFGDDAVALEVPRADGGGTAPGEGENDSDGTDSVRITTPPTTTPGPTTTTPDPGPTPPPTQPPPKPAVQTGVHLTTADVAVSVGAGAGDGNQTGVSVNGTGTGTPPPPPADQNTLTVDVGGTAVGNNGQHLAI